MHYSLAKWLQAISSHEGSIAGPWPACTSRRDVKEFHEGKVRSGVGTYVGVARRRVNLPTELLRSPSGHRPGERQD